MVCGNGPGHKHSSFQYRIGSQTDFAVLDLLYICKSLKV
jgi:hypothetical protein